MIVAKHFLSDNLWLSVFSEYKRIITLRTSLAMLKARILTELSVFWLSLILLLQGTIEREKRNKYISKDIR